MKRRPLSTNTSNSTYVKRKISEELISTSSEGLIDHSAGTTQYSPSQILLTGPDTPFDELPVEMKWKILRQVVVIEAQQKFVDTFTTFHTLTKPKEIPKNPPLVSVEKIVNDISARLSKVCLSWRVILINRFFKTCVKRRLLASEPGMTYRRRPKKLNIVGLEDTVIPHCITGFEGQLLALTTSDELITYSVDNDDPTKQSVRLRETSRYPVKDPGDVKALLTVENTDGQRVIVMYSRSLLNLDQYFLQTMTLTGLVITRWTLREELLHILRHGHGVFTVLYRQGNEVFTVQGNTIGNTLNLNINAIANNLYPPELAEVISDYSYVIDKRGCAVVAECGRTSLLDYNGKVILPRFFRFTSEGCLGWTMDWMNSAGGIILVKDLSLAPAVYGVFRN